MTKITLNLINGATIFVDQYLNHERDKQDQVDVVKNLISIDESYNQCVKCCMTHWNIFENPVFDDLKKWIFETANNHIRTLYKYTDDLEIKESWGLVYKKGDHAKTHTHFPYLFSYTYFLDTVPEHPPLVFDNIFPELIQYKPINGHLILFPSYVPHFVPENTVKKERIIISGNLK